jgi:hypothetical protein
MGEALKAFFQWWSSPHNVSTQPDRVDGYVADYTPASNAEIAAPAPCDDMLKTGNWVSVNRRA